MRIEYDPKHDLLNIEFISEGSIAESVELDGLIMYNKLNILKRSSQEIYINK